MPKGKFTNDLFEKGLELGTPTKQTSQALKKTFSLTGLIEHVTGNAALTSEDLEKISKEAKNKSGHTPLNLDALKQKYQKQEGQNLASIRQRLFQLVKSGEEKAITDKKRSEQEKQQKFLYEEQEKKKKEEEKKRHEQVEVIPRGKVRKSIFSHKKVAERQLTEVKPSTGKQ